MFSIIGIKLAVEEFYKMGCRKVTVFLPPNRQGNKGSPKIPDRERSLQRLMEKDGVIKVYVTSYFQCRFSVSTNTLFSTLLVE